MAYGTVAKADAYHRAAGNDLQWTGAFPDEAVRKAAIFRATYYIDFAYGRQFNGTPVGAVEEWPRIGSVDVYGKPIPSDKVPEQVEFATYIAALYDLENPNILMRALDPSEMLKRSDIGSIKKEFFPSSFGKPVILLSVEALLKRITISNRISLFVVK